MSLSMTSQTVVLWARQDRHQTARCALKSSVKQQRGQSPVTVRSGGGFGIIEARDIRTLGGWFSSLV